MGTGQEQGFSIFDHTADVGLDLVGDELSDIFEYAARGMYTILFHQSIPAIKAKGEYSIQLTANDLEQLLVDWLNELLYLFTTEQIVLSNFQITVDSEKCSLDATVKGEIVPEDKILGCGEIKAVTYHLLNVEKKKHWEARVLFDI